MIDASIVLYDQYSHVGDPEDEENIKDECKNSIKFDSQYLIVESVSHPAGDDLCTIFFDITPRLLKELKALIIVMEAHYCDDCG